MVVGASKTKEPGRNHHTTTIARITAAAMMSILFVSIATRLPSPSWLSQTVTQAASTISADTVSTMASAVALAMAAAIVCKTSRAASSKGSLRCSLCNAMIAQERAAVARACASRAALCAGGY